jgi:hypothetical protein
MTSWRLRDYLIVAGLVLAVLIVVVPIVATYAGVVEIDAGTGLLTVVVAACGGFLAFDSVPGRRF